MIKYNYLPGQPKDRIDVAEDIFGRMRKRNITNLPGPSTKHKVLLFSFEPYEEEYYVFFIADGECIGHFLEVTFCVHGVSRMESAKFQYENCD